MVDPAAKIYYNFKLDATTYVLYDEELGQCIMDKMAKGYGSLNQIGGIISRLDPDVMIYYFEKDATQGFKMKRVYHPDKEKVDIVDRKAISKKEDNKKKE